MPRATRSMRVPATRRSRSFGYGRQLGDEWDQSDAFAHFDHLMAHYDLGGGVIDVSEEELRNVAQAVAEAACSLS